MRGFLSSSTLQTDDMSQQHLKPSSVEMERLVPTPHHMNDIDEGHSEEHRGDDSNNTFSSSSLSKATSQSVDTSSYQRLESASTSGRPKSFVNKFKISRFIRKRKSSDSHHDILTSSHQLTFKDSNKTTNSDSMSSLHRHPSANEFIENDIDEMDVQDEIFSLLNQFEDKYDEQTYDEFVPLSIRLALETQVFGWTHLFGEIFGHIFYTVMAYLLTFWFISFIGLRYTPSSSSSVIQLSSEIYNKTQQQSPAIMDSCDFWCVLHKATYSVPNSSNPEMYMYTPIMGISPRAFVTIRILLSINSAISAFRTIRRRRRVWLRSRETYYDNERQTQNRVMESDRSTLLGRIRHGVRRKRDAILASSVKRKLKRAERRFRRRHERRSSFLNHSNLQADHHSKVMKLGRIQQSHSLSPRERTSMLDHNSSFTSDPWSRVVDPDDILYKYKKYENSSQTDLNAQHFYGHTLPNHAMSSITQDQIRFKSGMIKKVAYAHGGYFGAAPFMLANPHWIDILRYLMPDVYVEISHRILHTPLPQLIHWAENNAVVAAYGTAHEVEYMGKIPTLEWDVFIDPHLVERVQIVLNARDQFIEELSMSIPQIAAIIKGVAKQDNNTKHQERYSQRFGAIAQHLTEHQYTILQYYNYEIRQRVNILVENMLIAHGNATQLGIEQTGYLKRWNYSRVKHTSKTLGGGVLAKHWVSLYTQALKLSTKPDGEMDYSSEEESPTSECSISTSRSPKKTTNQNALNFDDNMKFSNLNDLGLSTCPPSSLAESLSSLKKIMKLDAPLGLILDLKSNHVPKKIWALVIDNLRESGARVEGIASFSIEEIRDISQFCSAPVKEMLFFHSAGDLQKACHDGFIKRGENVFFNAGSLFWNYPNLKSKSFYIETFMNTFVRTFDSHEAMRRYTFQSYARVNETHGKNVNNSHGTKSSNSYAGYESENTLSDYSIGEIERSMNKSEMDLIFHPEEEGSTIQHYKDHYDLSIGLYVQEFAIDDAALNLIVHYVNKFSNTYQLGLSWGGINGVTVHGIQPDRFTSTDGLWNQRYVGHRWDTTLFPADNE